MVAANVGITLLPMLAVKPPVAPSPDIRLVPFRDPPPIRRIAMVWRRSSAMSEFLSKLATVFRELPSETLVSPPRSAPSAASAPQETVA